MVKTVVNEVETGRCYFRDENDVLMVAISYEKDGIVRTDQIIAEEESN